MSIASTSDDLGRHLEALRAERGDQVSIDEVAEIVTSILATMDGDVSGRDLRLYKELDDLAHYIQSAKSEIAALNPEDINAEHLPAAGVELDAIVAATEEATGTLLEAAEMIETEAGRLGAQAISDQVVRIFEACSFQDLTGQRIGKVVGTLKYIEDRLDRLVAVFGDELRQAVAKDGAKARKPTSVDDEASLLNGPQLPGAGNNQDDIDALLASFD